MTSNNIGFFNNIRKSYGNLPVKLMKRWINISKRLARLKNRNRYLLRCKSSGFLPSHLINLKTELSFDNLSSNKIFNNNTFKYKISALNIEINDINISIPHLQYTLNTLKNIKIFNLIDNENFNNFFKIQELFLDKFEKQLIRKSILKFNWLTKKFYTFHFNKKPNPRWIKNLSDTNIPNDVSYFLSLGEKFYINPTNKSKVIENTLTMAEEKINLIFENKRDAFRSKLSNILQDYLLKNYNILINPLYNNIIKKTQQFFKEHNNLVICKADKGNVTVILNKNDYLEKCLHLLNDKKIYSPLKKDPTQIIQRNLNNKVDLLLKKSYINCPMSRHLKSYNSLAPKFYGLPKIHKTQIPMRPVTSFCGSPTYNLSKFISNPIKKIIGKTEFHIKNSFEFCKKIKHYKIPDDFILVSLDVKSLFTNIPKQLVLKCVKLKWKYIREHTKMPDNIFLDILDFCIENAYCCFNGVFYKQTFGTPMGSPLSGVIADLVMEKLENDVLKKLDFRYIFYFRYVDDIIICIHKNNVNKLLNTFNGYNENLQFTIEIENNGQISFLDTLLIRENDSIITNWHHKDTFSGKYLNFNSNASIKDKISIIYGLVDRAIKLSDIKFYTDNLNFIYNILIENDYPQNFLTKYINKRFENLFINDDNNTNKIPFDSSNLVVLPYVNELHSSFKKLYNEHNIRVVFTYDKDPFKIFIKNKDPTPFLFKNHVVYHIPCQCGASYIGETERYIKDRINEHKRDCRYDNRKSALVIHSHENDHIFKFDDTSIICNETKLKRRKFREMFYILKTQNSVNKHTDLNNLNEIYHSLILSTD